MLGGALVVAKTGTFIRYGIPELQRRVGEGTLRGLVVLDQVYAKYQHERMDLRHPRGGQAKFMELTIAIRSSVWMGWLAEATLDGDLVRVMADCMEDLDDMMKVLIPTELGVLKNSGNPRVLDEFRMVYNRPARWRRLTDSELNALRKRAPRKRYRSRRR